MSLVTYRARLPPLKGGEYDLEAQVYHARLEHELVHWRSRTWIAWALLAVLVLGWLHAYDHERRSIATHIQMLKDAGPPLECYYHANNPEHPIPLSLQVSYWLSFQDPSDVCHRYYVGLAVSRWPSPWTVTVKYSVDTFLNPARDVMHMLSQASWVLQVLLVFAVCATAIVYLHVWWQPQLLQRRPGVKYAIE